MEHIAKGQAITCPKSVFRQQKGTLVKQADRSRSSGKTYRFTKILRYHLRSNCPEHWSAYRGSLRWLLFLFQRKWQTQCVPIPQNCIVPMPGLIKLLWEDMMTSRQLLAMLRRNVGKQTNALSKISRDLAAPHEISRAWRELLDLVCHTLSTRGDAERPRLYFQILIKLIIWKWHVICPSLKLPSRGGLPIVNNNNARVSAWWINICAILAWLLLYREPYTYLQLGEGRGGLASSLICRRFRTQTYKIIAM